MLSAQVHKDWGKKKHHFSNKKLSVRKQLFHKTIIWHWASASTVISMKNIKSECAWITEIPAFARFSCSAFENFLYAGTLLVPRVHCYTGKACTSSGQQMWKQGKQGGKQPLGRSFIFWEAFVLCLFTQKLCCYTGDIAHTSGVKHNLCWACVAGFRHRFRSVCFSHLILCLSQSVLIPILIPVLVPASFIFTFCKPSSDWGSVCWYRSGSTAR